MRNYLLSTVEDRGLIVHLLNNDNFQCRSWMATSVRTTILLSLPKALMNCSINTGVSIVGDAKREILDRK